MYHIIIFQTFLVFHLFMLLLIDFFSIVTVRKRPILSESPLLKKCQVLPCDLAAGYPDATSTVNLIVQMIILLLLNQFYCVSSNSNLSTPVMLLHIFVVLLHDCQLETGRSLTKKNYFKTMVLWNFVLLWKTMVLWSKLWYYTMEKNYGTTCIPKTMEL